MQLLPADLPHSLSPLLASAEAILHSTAKPDSKPSVFLSRLESLYLTFHHFWLKILNEKCVKKHWGNRQFHEIEGLLFSSD